MASETLWKTPALVIHCIPSRLGYIHVLAIVLGMASANSRARNSLPSARLGLHNEGLPLSSGSGSLAVCHSHRPSGVLPYSQHRGATSGGSTSSGLELRPHQKRIGVE